MEENSNQENHTSQVNGGQGQQNDASFLEKLIYVFKNIYSKDAYLFIGTSAFSAIVLFFILDEGGSFAARLFGFVITFLIGGFIGMAVVKFADWLDLSVVKGFRRGAGTLLVFVTLLLWMNDGYEPTSYGSSSSRYSGGGKQHTCTQCGRSYTGIGWTTVGGEQYQPSSDPGYDQCCSKSCAWDSQPAKWKRLR